MPEQPDVREQLNTLIPDEADRAALWTTAWDAYYAQYNAFRDANPGWQAFFSAHHSSALDAALEALLPQIIERGIAEGLRQATEGPAFLDDDAYRVGEALEYYYRRLGSPPSMTRPYAAAYIAIEAATAGGRRLVGPWEPAPGSCCDLHGRNCEQGGEECCERCTEAHHFAPGHGGVPCSAPVFPEEAK